MFKGPRVTVPALDTESEGEYDSPTTSRHKLKYGSIPKKKPGRPTCGTGRKEERARLLKEAAKASRGLMNMATEAREAKEAAIRAEKQARVPKKPARIGMPPKKKKTTTAKTSPKSTPKKVVKTAPKKATTKTTPKKIVKTAPKKSAVKIICRKDVPRQAAKNKVDVPRRSERIAKKVAEE